MAETIILELTRDEAQLACRAFASHAPELRDRLAKRLRPATNTVGGGRDQTAVIAHAPEHADWTPADAFYPPQIDASARVEALVTIDSGVRAPTRVGARAWLLKHSHVGHDAVVGDDVTVACHAVIGGHVVIETGAFVGLGAIVAPFRTIGEGAFVEAGAVVIHDVPAGARVAGNPARLIAPRRSDRYDERPDLERRARPMPGFEGEELDGETAPPTKAERREQRILELELELEQLDRELREHETGFS